jgi:NitT/TauT family transport system ATP-binding protein
MTEIISRGQRARPSAAEEAAKGNAVEILGLTVEFDSEGQKRHLVVDNLSLTCEPGEFLVLIGPSGCGKTTVLNTLAGLITPTSGTVSLLGKEPREARGNLGYMLARDAMLPWRTALRNVEFSLEIHGLPRPERRAQAEKYLRLMKLDHAMQRYPWQLSHGMRQRVALARTWASEPDVILMDEPFSALDAQTRDGVRDEFLRIWESERKTVVFVTHDLNEAALLGDRIVLLNHGRIQLDERVPFERPRRASDLDTDPDFVKFRHTLWEALSNSESAKKDTDDR